MADRFALTRWEPFRWLTPWERALDRFFGSTLRGFDQPLYLWHRPLIMEEEHLPSVEAFDRDGQAVVRIEVPGIDMADIDISVADGVLAIKGEKKHEEEIKEENYYCSERSYDSFRRMLSVPTDIDESKISATYDSGVLEVVLPKVETEQEHKVKVKAKRAKK